MPQGSPEQVKVHDFVDKKPGPAHPYGDYDVANNSAWVSLGTDHDPASFAVATIRRWVVCHGAGSLPCRPRTDDHRRWRRKQRVSTDGARGPSLETGTAATCRRTWSDDPGEPLPSRRQQMESDGTPAVFVHQPELARPPPLKKGCACAQQSTTPPVKQGST